MNVSRMSANGQYSVADAKIEIVSLILLVLMYYCVTLKLSFHLDLFAEHTVYCSSQLLATLRADGWNSFC